MTDNKIIKALKIHANRGDCGECAYGELPSCNCQVQMFKDCLDLIDRQKAEIERLQNDLIIAKSETSKEFAEKLKAKSDISYFGSVDRIAYWIPDKDLDSLVKEMKDGSTEL